MLAKGKHSLALSLVFAATAVGGWATSDALLIPHSRVVTKAVNEDGTEHVQSIQWTVGPRKLLEDFLKSFTPN